MTNSCEPLRVWNRLESRPRQVDLDDVLSARVRDALWLLTRQWQFGEFHGEDTGSAVLARMARRSFPVSEVRLGDRTEPYDPATGPLEPLVGRLPPAPSAAARAQAGAALTRAVADVLRAGGAAPEVVATARAAFAAAYPLHRIDLDPADEAHALSVARRRSSGRTDRVLRALAGRGVDGVALAESLPGTVTWADLPADVALAVPGALAGTVLAAVQSFRDWYAGLWATPPAAGDAWDAERLEYDYGCTVARGTGVGLVGAPSPTGQLDWYSFDVESGPDAPPAAGDTPWQVSSAVPTPAEFAGMPSARWWQFEDGTVSLAGLRADSGDLAKLLVTEFALVYGNNWFVLPLDQRLGTLTEVAGIVVTDVFGVRTLVEPATGAAGANWAAWDLFSLSPRLPGAFPVLGQHLFLPPVTASTVEAPAQEEVVFLRDELSNTVWAVESRVPDGRGGSRDGAEAGRAFAAALAALEQELTGVAPEDAGADDGLVYRLATSVPEHWIPFVPVHRPSSTHEIRLQRGSMPRFFPSAVPRIRPVTSILRTGLADPAARAGRYPELIEDADLQDEPTYVNEEEVPHSGVVVRGAVQQARWAGGGSVLWLGRRTAPGRGEGNSGLRYDELIEPGGTP